MSKSDAIRLRNLSPQSMPQLPALPQQDPADAKLPSGDNVSTVDNLTGEPGGNALDAKRYRPANLVQHGHTAGEHAVYMALWSLGGPPDRRDEFREVSIGYDKLAALVGGSKRNVQRLAESLVRKLAIQVVRAEDSGSRQGKTYRVFGMAEILKRRREAGYTHVIRNRSAVILIKMAASAAESSSANILSTVDELTTVDKLTTVGSLSTETVDSLSTETVDSLSTPLGISFRNSFEETSSSAATVLVTVLQNAGIPIDDDAVDKIVAACRKQRPDATGDEIAYFADIVVARHRRNPKIDNLVGLMIRAVPKYFSPTATELASYRARKQREREREERLAAEILADPASSDTERKWARTRRPIDPGEHLDAGNSHATENTASTALNSAVLRVDDKWLGPAPESVEIGRGNRDAATPPVGLDRCHAPFNQVAEKRSGAEGAGAVKPPPRLPITVADHLLSQPTRLLGPRGPASRSCHPGSPRPAA